VKDAAVFLRHIRDAITRIETYTAAGRRAFLTDTMVQDAVIRNLEVIGEAVRNGLEICRLTSGNSIQRFPGGASLPSETS